MYASILIHKLLNIHEFDFVGDLQLGRFRNLESLLQTFDGILQRFHAEFPHSRSDVEFAFTFVRTFRIETFEPGFRACLYGETVCAKIGHIVRVESLLVNIGINRIAEEQGVVEIDLVAEKIVSGTNCHVIDLIGTRNIHADFIVDIACDFGSVHFLRHVHNITKIPGHVNQGLSELLSQTANSIFQQKYVFLNMS